jgi:hypothetical protein
MEQLVCALAMILIHSETKPGQNLSDTMPNVIGLDEFHSLLLVILRRLADLLDFGNSRKLAASL